MSEVNLPVLSWDMSGASRVGHEGAGLFPRAPCGETEERIMQE